MRVIERQSAGGHHTMGMWVMFGFLIPGVKHAKEADLGARMRIQAMREGAVEFLAKPVDHHLLLETAEHHLICERHGYNNRIA